MMMVKLARMRVFPENRSMNLWENRITGASTKVLKKSTVPTVEVGTPRLFRSMGA